MAYYYGKTSTKRLLTCCPEIQDVANELIKWIDVTIVCGSRGKVDQEKAFAEGKSKLHWPDSSHNVADEYGNELPDELSDAVDIAIYAKGKGLVWNKKSASYVAGMFMLIAWQKGYNFIWGGDWDQDNDLTDQNFEDLCHFQIVR